MEEVSADRRAWTRCERPLKAPRTINTINTTKYNYYTLTAKDPKQQIWTISGGLGGLESGGLEALGPPILDLAWYLPVLKKRYRGPLNVNVV